MGKESNAVVFKPLSGSTKDYAVFIADVDLVSIEPSHDHLDGLLLIVFVPRVS